MFKPIILLFLLCAVGGCGVRGKPQPPVTPAELGHGQPNFKRASEEFAIPNVPPPETPPTPAPRLRPRPTGD